MHDRLRPARIARRLSNARAAVTSLLRGMLAAARITGHTASARRLGLVLLFHRVAEHDGDPRRELVPAVGVERFQRQLRWTRRLFRPRRRRGDPRGDAEPAPLAPHPAGDHLRR